MRTLLIGLLLPTALSLSSCTPSRNDMSSTSTEDGGSHAPRTQLNPRPAHAYRVSLSLQDAPGTFQVVEGIVDYHAHYRDDPGRQCGYMIPFAGAFIALNRSESFELRKVADNTYEGVVYSDLMLDEDYNGEGICHWGMVEVRARLRANDNLTDTRFAPFLDVAGTLTEKSETRYFWKEMYPSAEVEDFPDFGESDRKQISRRDDELFTMTLAVKEVQP